jgi:two-component system, NarL family, response regulator YdfI
VTFTEPTALLPATRVLIVAAYPIARAGLTALLSVFPDLTIVGQSAGNDDLAALVDDTRPEVVLLDLATGDDDALERLERLLAVRPGLGALVLGTEQAEDALLDALGAGARGYLLRESSGEELAAAVRAVTQSLIVLGAAPANALLSRLLNRPRLAPGTGPGEALTPRELEVLQALAGGLTNRAIARKLSVSENTVKFHVSSILTKLDAASRAEAVALAARRGLLLL